MSDLGADEKRVLLTVARAAIAAALSGHPQPPLPDRPPALQRRGGAFVTLHRDHELRGCIGYVESTEPVVAVVARVAVSAAHDSRFTPLREDELARVDVEVSVLSALAPIRPDEVEVGRHGLTLECGQRRGLLLPQVPLKYDWDRETFLDQLCRKAGLPAGAWRRSDARLLAFTAQVFGERDGRPD